MVDKITVFDNICRGVDMNEKIYGLIGLKYGFSEGENHCVDLCRKFYELHGWRENFQDGKADPETLEEFNKNHKLRLLRYLLKNFDKVKDTYALEYGDVVIFNILGDLHCGIFIGHGDIIAMEVPCGEGSRSGVYKYKFWKKAFLCAFRRREVDV